MDTVEKVAKEIADIPGIPSSLETARVAIEAYQRVLWKPALDISSRGGMMPELRRHRANQLTSHIMQMIDKYLCDHGDMNCHREAARDLFEALYESGADIITDADRATAGLQPRGPNGITAEQLRIMEIRHTEAMLRPMSMTILARDNQ